MPDVIEDQVPPEEEELFREFQAYVRSVYGAATSGAIDHLEECVASLKGQIDLLTQTVEESRAAYADLFAPAVASFEAASEQLIAVAEFKVRAELATMRTETERIIHKRIDTLDRRVMDMLAAQRALMNWVLAIGGVLLAIVVGTLVLVLMAR